MQLHGGIDLHANNRVVVLLDQQDYVVYQKQLPNDLPSLLQQLSPYHASLRDVTVGNLASYCRCVGSQKLSNGKCKGSGNTKNGNKYLAWAFVEAAHFAVRYNPCIKRFYQRKHAKTNAVVATKAVAHTLARACFYILRDQVPFDVNKAFSNADAQGWLGQ